MWTNFSLHKLCWYLQELKNSMLRVLYSFLEISDFSTDPRVMSFAVRRGQMSPLGSHTCDVQSLHQIFFSTSFLHDSLTSHWRTVLTQEIMTYISFNHLNLGQFTILAIFSYLHVMLWTSSYTKSCFLLIVL